MDKRLTDAIRFSAKDLEANKQGRLTANQRRLLRQGFSDSVRVGKKFAYVLWAAAFLLLIGVAAAGVPNELTPQIAKASMKREPGTLRWMVFGLFAVATLAAGLSSVFLFVAHLGRRNLDSALPVFSVAGMAEKSEYETWYTLKVADREFVYGEANDPVFEAFEAGQRYRIFYIFNTANIIVSAERE